MAHSEGKDEDLFWTGFGTPFILNAHGETTRQVYKRADKFIKKQGSYILFAQGKRI
jgi:hypothetical protein